MTAPQQGFLLISDISGYTMYLTQSELEHAQGVLATLLEVLVDHNKPPLVVYQLAGDAVISYSPHGSPLEGQTFVELIEDTYVAFRRAIELMVLNNSCQCNACANISALDLKFFIHYGTFMRQRLGGRDELVGSDIILIHRLLKNHVVEQTGIRAYTLYSDSAIRQLGLEDFCAKLVAHREEYEHIGEVELWVQDMHPVWQQKREATRITIPPERVVLQVEGEIAMPPHLLWGYLARPEFYITLAGSDRINIVNRTNGRISPGSVYQCYHGDHLLTMTILEWRPFENMTSEVLTPIPKTHVLLDVRLVPTERGTRLVQTFSKAKGPLLLRTASNIMFRMMAKTAKRDLEAFRKRIEEDLAGRGAETEAEPTGSAQVTADQPALA